MITSLSGRYLQCVICIVHEHIEDEYGHFEDSLKIRLRQTALCGRGGAKVHVSVGELTVDAAHEFVI